MRCKNIALAAVGLLLASPLLAQDEPRNIVRIAPFGFINKVRLHYERVATDNASFGLIGTGYYGLFSGIKAEPFVRYYVSDKGAPRGVYFQAKMSVGRYSSDLCHDFVNDGEGDDWDDRHAAPSSAPECEFGTASFTTVGADLGIGAQGFIGKKKRTSIDFFLAFQFNRLPASFLNKTDATGYRTDWKSNWYVSEAGAIVAPMLSIGRSF